MDTKSVVPTYKVFAKLPLHKIFVLQDSEGTNIIALAFDIPNFSEINEGDTVQIKVGMVQSLNLNSITKV